MGKLAKHITILLPIILFGCSSLFIPSPPKHPETLSDKELIKAIQLAPSNKKPALALVEASKRGLISSAEVYDIMDAKLKVGMSETAMLCLMGIPNSIHRMSGGYNSYRFGHYRHLTYMVFIEDGKVSSWEVIE